MHRLLVSLGCVVGAVACAGDVEDNVTPPQPVGEDPLFNSGTRLKVGADDAGGGAKNVLFWWDSKLELACTFSPDPQGVLRCLPNAPVVSYADPGCSQPIVEGLSGTCAPAPNPFALEPIFAPEDACGNRPTAGLRVRRVGSSVGVGPIYQPGGTGCELVAEGERLDASEEVAATEFVAVTETVIDARGGGVGVEVWRAEDGSSQVGAGWSMAADERCQVMDLDQQTGGCLVRPGFYFDYGPNGLFADSGCSEPLVAGYSVDCQTPATMLAFTSGACGVTIEAHAVGSAVQATYALGDNTCSLVEERDDLYRLGAPLPGDDWKLQPAWLGTGRLQAGVWHNDAGQIVAQRFGWFDTEQQAPCSPTRLKGDAPGVQRCVYGAVVDISPGYLYADAACSEPVGAFYASPCGGPQAPAIAIAFEYGECDSSYTVHEVVAVGNAVYREDGGNCVPIDAAESGEPGPLYKRGPVIPRETFGAVVQGHE